MNEIKYKKKTGKKLGQICFFVKRFIVKKNNRRLIKSKILICSIVKKKQHHTNYKYKIQEQNIKKFTRFSFKKLL